jgi:hypothetical protein
MNDTIAGKYRISGPNHQDSITVSLDFQGLVTECDDYDQLTGEPSPRARHRGACAMYFERDFMNGGLKAKPEFFSVARRVGNYRPSLQRAYEILANYDSQDIRDAQIRLLKAKDAILKARQLLDDAEREYDDAEQAFIDEAVEILVNG